MHKIRQYFRKYETLKQSIMFNIFSLFFKQVNWNSVIVILTFLFLVPRNPVCTTGRPILSNRTAKIIYLDLSQIESYTNSSAFCVKVPPNTDDAECTTVVNSTFSIKNLETSTQYNFSVFTYVIEWGKLLLSASSCSLSVYTCKYNDVICYIKYEVFPFNLFFEIDMLNYSFLS